MLRRLAIVLMFLPVSAQALVSVEAPDSPLYQNEPFELNLVVDRPLEDDALRLEPLEAQFEILGTTRRQLSKFSNGQSYTATQWTLRLTPRGLGQVRLPSLPVGGEFSPSQVLLVQAARPPAPPEAVRIESEPEYLESYVGVPFKLQVRLYYRVALEAGARLEEPELRGARLIRLGQPHTSPAQVGDLTYQVLAQDYLLVPQQVGLLQIPAVRFQGAYRSESGAVTPTQASSPSHELEILRPPTDQATAWVPARALTLTQAWDQPLEQLRAGDTLTLTLTIDAQGVAAEQLPKLTLAEGAGYRVFEEPAQSEERITAEGIDSQSRQRFRLLLTRHGDLSLPAIELPWWNWEKRSWQRQELPAQTLKVIPFDQPTTTSPSTTEKSGDTLARAASATETPPPSAQIQEASTWMGWLWAAIALACAVGWTQTTNKLKRLRQELQRVEAELQKSRQRPATPQVQPQAEKHAYQTLARSCHHADPVPIAASLIHWAQVFWPQAEIRNLSDVRNAAQDPTLDYLVRNLEHRLDLPDADDEPWTGDILISQLRKIRLRLSEARDQR